jgi:thioredoxin 1
MRRIIFAAMALVALTTASLADFATFDKAKFDALVKSNATVVVHTHEWWCPTCRTQSNVLEGLQKDSKFSKVTMLRASPGTHRDALEPMKAATRSIIIVFAGGKEIGRLNWITDAAQIRALLEQAVKAGG